MTRAPRRVLLLLAAAVLALGCRGNAGAPTPVPPTPGAEPLSQAFAAVQGVLAEAAGPRARGDAAGLRQRSQAIAGSGLALLKARMPHDLQRAWVARFLEGRAVFGEALKVWVGAAEAGTDAEVLRAYDGLADAFRGWVDASKGRAPERAV